MSTLFDKIIYHTSQFSNIDPYERRLLRLHLYHQQKIFKSEIDENGDAIIYKSGTDAAYKTEKKHKKFSYMTVLRAVLFDES